METLIKRALKLACLERFSLCACEMVTAMEIVIADVTGDNSLEDSGSYYFTAASPEEC